MHDAESDTASRRELEVTWRHERARKSDSGGFLYRYKRLRSKLQIYISKRAI
jgi:hypothetical protein